MVASFFFLGGCTPESSLVPELDLLAVRAYLYAGQPVTDVNLTSTLSIDDESETAPPVNDAEVGLMKDGIRYSLALSDGDSGYYHYEADDLTIEAEDTFHLEIFWEDQFLTAETIVPVKPANAAIAPDTLVVPEIASRQDFIDWQRSPNSRAEITWQNEDSDYYYILFDNIEEDAEPVDLSLPPRFTRLITEPLPFSRYVLSSALMTHYGDHHLVLFRVNEEYVMLYQMSGQDSRDLNEPFSNIDGGLGVFAAFNSDTLLFHVSQGD